jgi:hypothetical protein
VFPHTFLLAPVKGVGHIAKQASKAKQSKQLPIFLGETSWARNVSYPPTCEVTLVGIPHLGPWLLRVQG